MGHSLQLRQVPVDPDCGTAHLGRCGGLSFAERLRSVRLDPSSLPTRTLRNYYDAEAVAQVFGNDSEERMAEDTEGLGYVRRRDGAYWQRDRKGEVREVSPADVIDRLAGEPVPDEGLPAG